MNDLFKLIKIILIFQIQLISGLKFVIIIHKKLKNINILPAFPLIDGIEFIVPSSDICSLFNSIKFKASKKNLSYSNQISLYFLRHEYIVVSDLFDNSSSQIESLKRLLRNYENDSNIYPKDKKMEIYLNNIKNILSFYQGQPIEIATDDISSFSEIVSSINSNPLQKVSELFIDVQAQYKKIKELIKIESLLSKIDENNIEKTKFQIIQSFLTKENKYHTLLIDILIYYSKIRPIKINFYIQLLESLIQNNSNNKKQTLSPQLSEKKLTMTLNKKRIIKPQIKQPQNRPKFSSSLQFSSNKIETIAINEFSNILISELKNPQIRNYFKNYFIFRLFSNSIITTKKQKLAILNIVKESNSDKLKEWFSSSLKTLTKEQINLYNKYTTYLNEEPIREAIRNDDVSEVKSILNMKNKSSKDFIEKMVLNNKIIFDFYSPSNQKVENKPIYITEYAAMFGSVDCFKYLLLNNFKLPGNIIKKAIRGGKIEIINLCIEKGFTINDRDNKLLNTTIKYHQNKIFKWLINSSSSGNQIRISNNPLICIQTFNFKAFFKTKIDNFNFIFELINYNNILLIELISPYVHSFIKLIMSYYSIINHSNEISKFLYNSINEICYPLNYLSQLKNENDTVLFNSIIKSCNQDKFEKDIVFILFCFINDNIDFLKFLLTSNNKKEKSQIAFKAIFYGGSLFNSYKLTLCQKYIFSLASGFINEEKVISIFQSSTINSTKILFLIFENLNLLQLKFNKNQLSLIISNLLRDKNCRSIILKNYYNFVSNECLLKLIEEEEIEGFEIFYELASFENIDINLVLKLYLNKLSLKFRPDSREKRFNSSLTSRRLTTSFNERENDKKFMNLCFSHPLFNINYEFDDRNSYLHLIVMNDLDYILRFIITNPIFKQILNKCNRFNKTPLIMAIEYQNIECIQILIEQNGINTSIYDNSEMNALSYAIQNNLIDFVSRIIEDKKKTTKQTKNIKNETNNNGIDIINIVSKNRHISPICCSMTIEMINLILSQGASSNTFNCVDKEGKTLLVKSLENNKLDYKFLLNNLNGIDINAKCTDGKTFIMKSIELNQYESIIDYLEKNPIQTTKSSNLSKKQTEQKSTTETTKSSNLNKKQTEQKSTTETTKSSNLSKKQTEQKITTETTKSSILNKKQTEQKSTTETTKSYDIDYTIKSKENSYLASAIKAGNFDLIEQFLSNSLKAGNDQAALIESLKQKGTNYSTITNKLISTYKKKLELTPQQVVEDFLVIPEKYFDFFLKQEKDPHKAFNSVFNDKTILISSIMNNNNSLFKFLVSNNNLIDLNFNWSNSDGLNCFDFAIQFQNKEITEILFKETKLNKSVDSFEKIIVKKNKFNCSLKIDETIKNKWISETLKKKKDQLFIGIIESNNVELFNLIINDIDNESLINKGLEIAISKRFDSIVNSLTNNSLLNQELAIKFSIAQNNAALFKSLVQKFNGCINMNKFVEDVLNSNQNIQNIYLSYAQISDYTKKLLKNEIDFSFTILDVNNLLQFVK